MRKILMTLTAVFAFCLIGTAIQAQSTTTTKATKKATLKAEQAKEMKAAKKFVGTPATPKIGKTENLTAEQKAERKSELTKEQKAKALNEKKAVVRKQKQKKVEK